MVSEGDFNFLGTGLPQYEEDEVVVRKAIGVHEQVVRDQQGRIRFHGAFTGGFSAGYFNTVDTKEGWTPQTFKSSRNERASHAQQKPEDFMDEEDTGEFGIAPKSLKATHEFRKHQLDVEDQLQLARLHIGTRMLRRMGWRKGEKLGERKRKKKTIHTAKVYGCSLPPALLSSIETENKEDEDSEEEDDDVDLREEDMCKVVFVTKSDLFGLGYRGMQEVKNTSKTPTKHRDRGQAFGVGAFEEEDEDVYNNDNLKNYNFHLSHDDDTDDHLRGWTAPKHHYDTKLKNVLRGFKKASEQTTSAKLFLPPDLPSNFKAFRSVFQDTQASTQVKDTHFRFHRPEFYMNRHYKRGELLGEKPRISSVFELLSEEDKARIEASKERRKSRGIDGGERKSRWSRGEEKHQEEVVREPEAVTEWEKEWKKPMNMMMASRFVKETGEASSEVKEEKKGVGREVVVEWHPAKLLCVRFNIEDPYPSSQIVGLLTSKQAKPSFFDMNTPISVVLGSHLIDQTPKKTSTQSSDKKKSTEEVLSKKTSDKKPLALLASVDFTAPSPSSNLKLISPDQPLKLIPPDQPPKPKFSDQPLNLIPPDIQRSRETHSQGAVETIKDDLVENFKSKPSIDVFKSIFESSDEYEEDVDGKNEEKSEKVEEESEVRDVLDDDKVAQELNEAPQKASINQDDGVWIEKSFKKDKKKKHKKEKKNKKKTKKKEKQKKKRASSSSSS